MFPHKIYPHEASPHGNDSAWEILAPAKLNLYLEVLGKRSDGFHALETLMVPVRIYDQLRWRTGINNMSSDADGLTLRVRSLLPGGGREQNALGNLNNNLILRAARLLAETAGIEPHGQFDLVKRIPVQAGMGGGSSNAAAALMLANAAWNVGFSREQLLPLAAKLGSDVPFFFNKSAAVCRGRGELMEPVAQMPRLHFVVVKPPAGLSTADVFRQLACETTVNDSAHSNALSSNSHSHLSQLLAALRSGRIATACKHMTNRLEQASQQLAPWLTDLRETFARLGCIGHFMTGSGSAYVGVLRTAIQAQNTARLLAGMNLGNVYATSSC